MPLSHCADRFGKALDLMEDMEQAKTVKELNDVAIQVTWPLKRRLPDNVLDELRKTYKSARTRLAQDAQFSSHTYVRAGLFQEALEHLAANARIEALANLKSNAPDVFAALDLI